MGAPNSIGGWVTVDAPEWLWGGAMLGFFRAAQLQIRQQPEAGTVLVRTLESYAHTQPDLVRLVRALGPAHTTNGLDDLSKLADDVIEKDVVTHAQDALSALPVATSQLVDLATFYQLASAGVPSAELPSQARAAWESLREVALTEAGSQAFPHAGVYAVRRSDVVMFRFKLISVLLRVQHDPAVAAGDITSLKAGHDAGSVAAFAAGADLHNGLYMLDPYVGALLGATSPGVWGFASFRGRGPIVYSLGQQVAGTAETAPELLRTLYTPGADRVTHFDEWSSEVVPTALIWWVGALNSLFAVVSDWATFADADGKYQASKHLQAVASVEQMFRRMVSIQASHHDLNARRVLLFTVLDTLQALTGRAIEKHCDHDFAQRTLDRLAAVVPVDAHPLLLVNAHRGVDALREVQDGFFLRSSDGTILARPSAGRALSVSEAAAQYMKILRDATHGHGSNKAGRREITETLLACHDGRVPHDIGFLAWLYLLDVLANPDILRAHLRVQASR